MVRLRLVNPARAAVSASGSPMPLSVAINPARTTFFRWGRNVSSRFGMNLGASTAATPIAMPGSNSGCTIATRTPAKIVGFILEPDLFSLFLFAIIFCNHC